MNKILYVLPVLAVLGMLSVAHAQVSDMTDPTFVSGTYDKETGVLILTFSETIDISETNLKRIRLNDIKLDSDGSIDRNAPDSATMAITVNPPLRDTLVAADSVEIDFRRNAVADIAGNLIQISLNHALTLVEETPDPQMPPLAPDTVATTDEDTPVTVTPAISDPDGDTPRISAVADPPNGSMTFGDTTITYTPDQDYEGTDTFSYTVTDGQAETQGTITVTVTRNNNNPVLENIDDQAATVGVQLDIVPVVTDADPTDTHTYSIDRGMLPTAAIFTTSDGRLVWTPDSGDASNTHTVTITVDDGRGGTYSETFDIAVGAMDTDTTPQTVPTVTITAAGRFVEDAGTVEITRSDSMEFTVGFTNNHDRDHTILADVISYNDWHSGADIPIASGVTVEATFTIEGTPTIRDMPMVYFVFGVADDPATDEREPDTIKGDHLIKIRITEPAS